MNTIFLNSLTFSMEIIPSNGKLFRREDNKYLLSVHHETGAGPDNIYYVYM